MRVFIIALLAVLLTPKVSTGTTYFVYFKYKKSEGYSINQPSQYLSYKSISRRSNPGVAIDSTDLPVSRTYLAAVGSHVNKLLFASKWLNGVLVDATTDQIARLSVEDFVKDIEVAYAPQTPIYSEKLVDPVATDDPYFTEKGVYGFAYEQVVMLNGHYLHGLNLLGANTTIAVIDAGFSGYKSLSAFSSMVPNVIDSANFIKNLGLSQRDDNHGTKVLSLLAARDDGQFFGSAIDAKYALYISESSDFEQLVEEYTWALAAERADSIGCDIITTSLGYNKFDISSMNHTIDDISKDIAPISIAASRASSKGMLVFAAAGNEGNKQWEYVTFPADSPGVIAVGAVNNKGKLGLFSSIGLPNTSKPDMVCMGVSTSVINSNGEVVRTNGTSYSTPQIAGFTACLWGAFPRASAQDIRRALLLSSSNFETPNNEYGYGIPNFERAYSILNQKYPTTELALSAGPNPFTSYLNLQSADFIDGVATYYIYGVDGRIITSGTVLFSGGRARLDNVGSIRNGWVILKVIFGGVKATTKLIKLSD